MVDLRLYQHPILEFKRGRKLRFYFEGKELEAYEGETVAAALLANGIKVLRYAPKTGRPRGFFCAIGKCSSCLMVVDGAPNVRTCIALVKDGMKVGRQRTKGVPREVEQEFRQEKLETDLLIVGGGPAGLSAAITACELGLDCLIVDENPRIGGQLIKQTHKFFGFKDTFAGVRGVKIAEILKERMKALKKAKYFTSSTAVGVYNGKRPIVAVVKENNTLLEVKADKIVVATGAMENHLAFPNNDLPGIYGAGAVQTVMNVYGVKPGNRALIVGAGNVGLILAYQLLQAGVEVAAIVEAMPRVGGYLVHASKVARYGVPIYTRHTIKEAIGREWVEKAVIVQLDESWQPIPGTERELDVDLVCIAVGLSPSCELALQAGAEKAYVPELGGLVAIHNPSLETTVEGLYVAGDASGVEEASTAMIEGQIAAADAALDLNVSASRAKEIKERGFRTLEILRDNPFSERVKKGKEKVFEMAGEEVG